MKLYIKQAVYLAVFVFLAALLAACGGGGTTSTAGGTTGTLVVGLTDDTGDYLHVFITIAEVQVNKASLEEETNGDAGWNQVTLFDPPKTIDLLELDNGNILPLLEAELETGQYNQMRLILGAEPEPVEPDDDPDIQHPYANYVVVEGYDPAERELKVPSGYQSGIKIVKGFTIYEAEKTEVILDFDALKSVVQAGNSGKWLLKPTIKVMETAENSISGTVADAESSPLPEASVSAQTFWENELHVKDSSKTDENGNYKLLLPPDIYNVVVVMEGYLPACKEVDALYYEEVIADFTLDENPAETITIEGTVTGLADGETVYLSVRQADVTCEPSEELMLIEVDLLPVAKDDQNNDPDFSFTLPEGPTYTLVAYTADETVESGEISATANDLNIDFTP